MAPNLRPIPRRSNTGVAVSSVMKLVLLRFCDLSEASWFAYHSRIYSATISLIFVWSEFLQEFPEPVVEVKFLLVIGNVASAAAARVPHRWFLRILFSLVSRAWYLSIINFLNQTIIAVTLNRLVGRLCEVPKNCANFGKRVKIKHTNIMSKP